MARRDNKDKNKNKGGDNTPGPTEENSADQMAGAGEGNAENPETTGTAENPEANSENTGPATENNSGSNEGEGSGGETPAPPNEGNDGQAPPAPKTETTPAPVEPKKTVGSTPPPPPPRAYKPSYEGISAVVEKYVGQVMSGTVRTQLQNDVRNMFARSKDPTAKVCSVQLASVITNEVFRASHRRGKGRVVLPRP